MAHSVMVVLLALASMGLAQRSTSVVRTQFGPVQGYIDPTFGSSVFKGVPFAAPPVGKLRFQPPADPQPWNDTLATTEFSAGCMAICNFPQPEITCAAKVSEDCLYLNVYSPGVGHKAPVLVFIHGGAYNSGSAMCPLYDAAQWASQGVVVVAMNYRLNVFGALYTGTTSGNYNIQDQRKAMKWVAHNIAAFGGDPNQVTIFGQSAGGMSVGVHLTSPLSYPYFRRAAMMSYPMGIRFTTPEMGMWLGAKALDKMGCPHSGGERELECLQQQNADFLLNNVSKLRYDPVPGYIFNVVLQWTPTVDGDVVAQEPMHGFESGNFAGVPTMMGSLANESNMFVDAAFTNPIDKLEYDVAMELVFGKNASVIKQLYGPPPSQHDRIFMSQVVTDYLFYCPARHVARKMVQNDFNPFVYYFDHLSKNAAWFFNMTEKECQQAVCHGDDLPFLFNSSYAWPKGSKGFSNAELALVGEIQGNWTTFAMGGIPWDYFSDGEFIRNETVPVGSPMAKRFKYDKCDAFDLMGYIRR
jgi:carboxylesterase type B